MPNNLAGYKLPPDLAEDIELYQSEVDRFLAGGIAPAVFKARRVPRGVYEQRRDGTFMVRVRVAGGVLSGRQAAELAALSREYGDGRLHVTTRQDVQLHDVAIKDTPAVMRRLLEAGLTSKGGGGNTVRNVTACPYAGVCPCERFDVTPAARAVTEYLIALAGSYNLPRKYKIAFSGCGADCALAGVSDLGFLAEVRAGRPGFRVLAGGGLGARSRTADLLLDWSPAGEVIRVAETVRRLFDRLGDRRDRNRARLRFVFERLGAEEFRRRFDSAAAEAVREGVPEWPANPELNRAAPDRVPGPPAPRLREGLRVVAQRQEGLLAVPLHLPLGFLPADDFARLGELAARHSREGGLRTTRRQNLLLRSVGEDGLGELAAGLRELETDLISPEPLERFVACAGASTCRLGICLARPAARSAADALGEGGFEPDVLEGLEIHLNGCSNSCGQHPAAPIGFFGGARREGGRLLPVYGVLLGGGCGPEGARLGTPVGEVPARALPALVGDLAADFRSGRRPGETFSRYFHRSGPDRFRELADRHRAVPAYEESPEYYRDWGAGEDFSLAGRGAGECGAGVFEVIDGDLREARRGTQPYEILLPAVRALLITRGVDALDADTIFREFERHFIDTGLVGEEFRELLTRARGYGEGWESALDGRREQIERLRERVELLYSTLDGDLRFHPPDREPAEPGKPESVPEGSAAVELDLSGVACPMNFVKAKLKLEGMAVGETLSIILDDGEPVRNVPASFRSEGQEVGEIADRGDGHWRVEVRKVK